MPPLGEPRGYPTEKMIKGVYGNHDRSLEQAMQPVAKLVETLEWCVSLQSGPFREIYRTEEDDERNLLKYFHDFSSGGPAWFRRGLLPQYADELVLDEWSYYLGFDASSVDAQDLSLKLEDNIRPSSSLLEYVSNSRMLYFVRVDEGWWEAYSGIPNALDCILAAWNGRVVDGMRWADGGLFPHPDCG